MSRSTYHVATCSVTCSESDTLNYAVPVNNRWSLRTAKARIIADTRRLQRKVHQNSCFDVAIVAR